MMNKRFLGIILAISMLMSLCSFNITAQAAIGIEHEAEVSKLNAFGILTGYPDTSYKASTAVTAKDFTAAAYKLSGKEGDFTAEMASKFGFGVDDKTISVQNTLAVLLTALDYGYEADAQGGYPSGYIKAATTYGILDGVSLSATDNLTNDAMAVILYNALELDAIKVGYSNGYPTYSKDNESVMERLGIYESKGIVTGTEYAAMKNCRKSDSGEIIIDNNSRYALGRTYAESLFGYSVDFYYNEDNELLWIDARNSMTASRVAEIDVIEFDKNGIRFEYDGNKKKTYSFSDTVFVLNGVSVDNPDLSIFVPTSGYITIVDNDNDNVAEVVSCESYEYYLVSEKNENNMSVNDYEMSRTISLNPNDYRSVRIVKEGKVISFEDINKDDVIAVMRTDSSSGDVLKVIVSSYKSVTGTVKSTSARYIKIDGNVYDVSTAYEGSALSTGKAGAFYFDINGNIVRFVKGKNTTSQYAYLISAYIAENGDDCYVEFLTAGNTVEERKISKKVKYNSSSSSPSVLCEKLGEKQLITYSLDSAGEIKELNVANKNNMYSGRDEENELFSQYFQGHGRYRKNNMCFNSKYLIDADTPIFVVPSSRKKEDYEIRYASSLNNGTSYYISVYDIDEFMTAGAIVLDEVASDPESLKAKRSVIVEDVSTAVNEDDELIVIVEGYQQGSRVTLKTRDIAVLKDAEGKYYSLGDTVGYTQLSTGDVIQTSVDSDGYLTAFRTLYKADEAKKKLVIADNNTPNEYEEGGNANEFADLFVLRGEVTSRSANILVVESDTKRAHRITSGVAVYVVEGETVEKVSTSDICVYDEVYLHTYQGNLQEVVIYR